MRPIRTESDARKRIIGPFFRKKRIKAGLTQWDVARHLNYSTAQFVSNWERGVSLPPLVALPKLAELFAVPPREFIAVLNTYQETLLDLSRQQLEDAFRRARLAA